MTELTPAPIHNHYRREAVKTTTTTEYGYICDIGTPDEHIGWTDLDSAKRIRRNMRRAGHTCEVIARGVTPHRFITITEDPS